MVPCRLLVLALAVHAYTAATSIAPRCPRSLETVLAGAPCSGYVDRLLTAVSRTTIESISVQDVCLDSLRTLAEALSVTPCAITVRPATVSGHSHMRRLNGNDGRSSKLNCTFDSTTPLNQSNTRQSFIMECKEITDPDNYTWTWWVIGCVVIPLAIWCLFAVVGRGIASGVARIKRWGAQRALDRIDRVPKGLFSKLASQA